MHPKNIKIKSLNDNIEQIEKLFDLYDPSLITLN